MSHSSEGREQIWGSLWRRYSNHPPGLGPGNSRWQTLTIEERVRPTVGPTETFDTGADGHPGSVRGGSLAAAALGAWVLSWINANTIETLHFRHVWLFLAMACALGMMAREERWAESGEPARGIPALAGARAVAVT